MPSFDPRTTALVLIDLQKGIVGMELAPRSGEEIVRTAENLAARFRAAHAPVVLVHVHGGPDGALRPPQASDRPMQLPPAGTDFSEFVDGLRHDGDIVVLKHHWGAFTGTDLDLQLRRRGVKTIVLAGIATNMGVESTARSGWELGYDLVIVENGCTSRSEPMHRFAFDTILPMIARVVGEEEIALG